MIPEAALWSTLQLYQGWRYVSHAEPVAHYPVDVLPGGIRVRAHGVCVTDCCSLVEGLVLLSAQAAGVEFHWSLALHWRAMGGMAPRIDRWGPVEAYVAAGLADTVDVADCPPWTVVQLRTADEASARGHTIMVVRRDGDRLLVLDAYRPEGVRWRGLRAIDVGPPEAGPPVERPVSLAALRGSWPVMRGAALRVG